MMAGMSDHLCAELMWAGQMAVLTAELLVGQLAVVKVDLSDCGQAGAWAEMLDLEMVSMTVDASAVWTADLSDFQLGDVRAAMSGSEMACWWAAALAVASAGLWEVWTAEQWAD